MSKKRGKKIAFHQLIIVNLSEPTGAFWQKLSLDVSVCSGMKDHWLMFLRSVWLVIFSTGRSHYAPSLLRQGHRKSIPCSTDLKLPDA